MIALGELSGTLYSGKWYQYEDVGHTGACQTDHELHFKDCIICIECKLTQTPNAHLQMSELYIPILEKVHRKKVYGIQATSMLIYSPEILIHDIADFVFFPKESDSAVWHLI